MTTGAEGSTGGCPRWAKILLIGSLALNATVIGLYIAQPMKDKPRGAGNRQIEWILKLVPDERRDFTKAHFADIRGELRAIQNQRGDLLDSIIAVTRAVPFSSDDMEAVLVDRRDASTKRRKLVHERLISLLEAFTPEERAVFADRMEERVAKWREKRRDN